MLRITHILYFILTEATDRGTEAKKAHGSGDGPGERGETEVWAQTASGRRNETANVWW